MRLTSHVLQRARERDLDLNLIADWVTRSYALVHEKEVKFSVGSLTIVAKREGKEPVVVTAWKNEGAIAS